MPPMMVALDSHQTKPKQIVIVGKPDAPEMCTMLRAIHGHFVPNKILILADNDKGQAFLGKHLECIQSVKMNDGKATLSVCQNYICQLPTTDIAAIVRLITGKAQCTGSASKIGADASAAIPSVEPRAKE